MNRYHFESFTEKGNWNHLNSYVIEGDYGDTITKELVEFFYKNGEFGHQTLDEMVSGWVETDEGVDDGVVVYDWFN